MNASIPYLGYRISLLSNSDIRYEGILSGIDSNEATVTLRNVRSMGTEGRTPHREILPSAEIYDCIVFRGQNIKDLTVCGNDSNMGIYQDPAIIVAQPSDSGMTNNDPNANSKNFYPYGNNDTFNNMTGNQPQSWDSLIHQPTYTSRDLIDNSSNSNNYTSGKDNNIVVTSDSGLKNENKEFSSKDKKINYFNKNPNRKNTGSSNVNSKKLQLKNTETSAKKEQFKDDFDFEQSNSAFKKEQRTVTVTYQPSNFFDNISSDTHEVARERGSQRKLDLDTFGESVHNYRPRRFNQNKFRRGGHNNNRR